jgi:hypothetical protein
MYFVVESVCSICFKEFPVFGLLWFIIVMYFMLRASISFLRALLNDDKESTNNSQNSSRSTSTKLAGMKDGDYINEYGMIPPRMSRTIVGDSTPVAPYVSVTTPSKVQHSTDTLSEQPKPFTRIEDLEPIDWEDTSSENTSTEPNNKSIESRSVIRSFDVNRASDFKQVSYTDFIAERKSATNNTATSENRYQSLSYSRDPSLWFSNPVDYSDELDNDLDFGDEARTSSSAF